MRRCLSFLVVSSWMVACSFADDSRPNIIIIYADDLGYGDVGAYGATAVKTPEVDRLAKEGMRFTSGYASAATCTPSRFALLTGTYPWRLAGIRVAPSDAALMIKPGTATVASLLKSKGYSTHIVGKWHLGLGDGKIDWNGKISPGPLEVGFDSCFILPSTLDRVPTVFVENHAVVGLEADDPLVVSYSERIDPSPSGAEARDQLKQNWSHGHNQSINDGVSRIGWQRGGEAARWKDEEIPDVLTQKAIQVIEASNGSPFFLYLALPEPHVPRLPNPRFVGATEMGPRGDVIAQADWVVGQITQTLDRLQLTENTLVIFTSDNGPVLDDGYQDEAKERVGDHRPAGPFRGWKYSRYEGGTRVPLIVRWPGQVPAGKVSHEIVNQVDFLATFAALVGAELGQNDALDSIDQLATFSDPAAHGRDTVIQEGITGLYGFRKGDWKYHHPSKAGTTAWETGIDLGSRPIPQLYDLAKDPAEANNVAEDHPEIVEAMELEFRAIQKAGRTRP